jgi:hypothetical protein
MATAKAACDFLNGRAKSGAVALSVAGASLATQNHFKEERQNDHRRR